MFEVWSAGTEAWERVYLDPLNDASDELTYVHSKPVNNVLHDFFKDRLNRWFRCPRRA